MPCVSRGEAVGPGSTGLGLQHSRGADRMLCCLPDLLGRGGRSTGTLGGQRASDLLLKKKAELTELRNY